MNIDNLEVKDESGKYLYVCCPYHNDSIASLCINKVENNGKPVGFYYCFGCGKSGEITPEQVDKLATKKGYSKKLKLVNWCKMAIEFTAGRLSQNYPGDFVYKGSGDAYIIGWDSFDACYTYPMWDAAQEVVGIHTRDLDGTKRSIEGSRLGLFLPVFITDVNETIIICEGLSDTLVAYHCTGLNSIGLPSATFGHTIVRDFLKNTHFKGNIIIVCDSDEAGFDSAHKLVNILDKKYPITVVLPTPYEDLRCFYEHCGLNNTTKLLLPGDKK